MSGCTEFLQTELVLSYPLSYPLSPVPLCYPLSLIPYPLSLVLATARSPTMLAEYSVFQRYGFELSLVLSLVPCPLSRIPLSLIPYPVFLIPYPSLVHPASTNLSCLITFLANSPNTRRAYPYTSSLVLSIARPPSMLAESLSETSVALPGVCRLPELPTGA